MPHDQEIEIVSRFIGELEKSNYHDKLLLSDLKTLVKSDELEKVRYLLTKSVFPRDLTTKEMSDNRNLLQAYNLCIQNLERIENNKILDEAQTNSIFIEEINTSHVSMSMIQKVDVLGLTEKDMHTTRVTLID